MQLDDGLVGLPASIGLALEVGRACCRLSLGVSWRKDVDFGWRSKRDHRRQQLRFILVIKSLELARVLTNTKHRGQVILFSLHLSGIEIS